MKHPYSSQFDVSSHLNQVPKTFSAPEFYQPGVEGLFYESAFYEGKTTRCFAWLGIPEGASSRHPVPGIVLVHGGGGTAFAHWVAHWNSLGYAAIAMDTCGCVPAWSSIPTYHPQWPRHPNGGAPGWGGFNDLAKKRTDQWIYQAMAAVLRATALLRSRPEVCSEKIGIAGISWGGFLTIISNAVAPGETYQFGIPVYASAGFTQLPTSCLFGRPEVTKEQAAKWNALWDPSPALKQIHTPMLFLTDAEDSAFALPTWEWTTENTSGSVQRSMRIEFNHDHESSMRSRTEAAFADAILQQKPLPQWGKPKKLGNRILCGFLCPGCRIREATLCITRAEGFWADRKWRSLPATETNGTLEATLLYGVKAAFFHITDEYGCQWSSPVLTGLTENEDFWEVQG